LNLGVSSIKISLDLTGQGKSILCQKNTYLLELLRYIHLNPIRAGIVKRRSILVPEKLETRNFNPVIY